MSKPTWRDISTPFQQRQFTTMLQSMFFSELISPSNPLWIFSGWISDIPIFNNSARQFQALCPNWEAKEIILSELLEAICARGGRVAIILRKTEHNQTFIKKLFRLKAWQEKRIGIATTRSQHAKAIISEHFIVDGSMNFTYNGLAINNEKMTYRSDPKVIQEEMLKLEQEWNEKVQWGKYEEN